MGQQQSQESGQIMMKEKGKEFSKCLEINGLGFLGFGQRGHVFHEINQVIWGRWLIVRTEEKIASCISLLTKYLIPM